MTTLDVLPDRETVTRDVKSGLDNLIAKVVMVLLVAWPLSWLWDNALVSKVTILGPIGDDYADGVFFWFAFFAVVGFVMGLRPETSSIRLRSFGDSLWRAVNISLVVWAAFGVCWLVKDFWL